MTTKQQQLIERVMHRLGHPLIDIELTPEQMETCLSRAFSVYRQRASNALEESYIILKLQDGIQNYTLPEEIMEVREIFKRNYSKGTSGTELDPVSLAYSNVYLLEAGRAGGLATYEMYSSYVKTAGRMFGMYINFVWHPATHNLNIMYNPRGEEEVLLWTYNYIPNEILLSDTYRLPWLEDWTLAEAKEIIGQARSKFANIPGPTGGSSLNGAELKAEANEMKTRLLEDLANYCDGGMPLGFIIG